MSNSFAPSLDDYIANLPPILTKHLENLPLGTPEQLYQVDRAWWEFRQNCQSSQPPQILVDRSMMGLTEVTHDVIIIGGTLGIMMGCALQQRGWRVVVIERGQLRGRDQEWNISRHELERLVSLELLTPSELNTAVVSTFNPVRVGFGNQLKPDLALSVRDILNLGIDPVYLLATFKQKFLANGGTLLEQTAFHQATVHPNGVSVALTRRNIATNAPLTINLSGRLLLDAMGHFSPIARQARYLQNRHCQNHPLRPDGVCMVVGTCASGFQSPEIADLMYSFQGINDHYQPFWEAFPARDGRTTYRFAYLDADLRRPSFAKFLANYLHELPTYQNTPIAHLQFKRLLYGFFPSYRQSPLTFPWHRILPIGDSSGMQSPLSFGGFGAMVRHLPRLCAGLDQALAGDYLSTADLATLQPYQPNLSVTWLFQKAMTIPLGQTYDPHQINHLLCTTFRAMQDLGAPVLRPFLQDVVQFSGLSQTMLAMSWRDPLLVARLVTQLGILPLADWSKHYLALAVYSVLNRWATPITDSFQEKMRYAAWQYGAGQD